MTTELHLVKRCEHGSDRECDAITTPHGMGRYCDGGSVTVLDPERVVENVWVFGQGLSGVVAAAADDGVTVRQAHVTVTSFVDALEAGQG